jgi:hypothetical protein
MPRFIIGIVHVKGGWSAATPFANRK